MSFATKFLSFNFLLAFGILFTLLFMLYTDNLSSLSSTALQNVLFKNNGNKNVRENEKVANQVADRSYRPKLFCLILTQPKNFHTRAKLMYDLWAHKCDFHRFLSVIPDQYLLRMNNGSNKLEQLNKPYVVRYLNDYKMDNGTSTIELTFEKDNMTIMKPAAYDEEKYEHLTTKMFTAFRDVYRRYDKFQFDLILKADDDTFVFMDKLREFISDKNASQPVTYGFDFTHAVERGYNSGGAGYLLTNESFQRLGSKLDADYNFCINSNVEDVDVGKCLRRLDINTAPTNDSEDMERFYPISFPAYLQGLVPSWVFDLARIKQTKNRPPCCSNTTISFHYMDLEDAIALNKIYEPLSFEEKHNFPLIIRKYINETKLKNVLPIYLQ